jgi:hypothetical protein
LFCKEKLNLNLSINHSNFKRIIQKLCVHINNIILNRVDTYSLKLFIISWEERFNFLSKLFILPVLLGLCI